MFLPACFCFRNHDDELELVRYFNLRTFLRYLDSSYSTYLHYLSHFCHPLALASYYDSHTSRRSTRPLGLLVLHIFFVSTHSHTTSSPFLTILLFSSPHALEDTLPFLLSYVALTFTSLSCFDTILHSYSRFAMFLLS